MKTRVLVAYASKYGSTKEVAESIADTLKENGLAVDLKPSREVRSLEEYTAVVLGAPLYMIHWHKDAHKFLSWHRETLINLPVAVFALGPLDDKEEEWKEVRSQLEKELAKFSWLKPVAVEVFGGKFDPKNLRFPDNLLARLPASPIHDMPARDTRDWDAIRAWARSLASRFQPVLPE